MVDVIEDPREWDVLLVLNKKDCPYRYYPANIVGCTRKHGKNIECNKDTCHAVVGKT
jgi:hypothetical protein